MSQMINAKKRFEILKRDWFRCMYCGKTWKDVSLEVDHIIPKSKWWTDDLENLITCCRECNMWKWNTDIKENKWYKYIINEYVKKTKSDFYKEWNKKWLGTIDSKTTRLLSIIVKELIWWDNYISYLTMPWYLWYDLSQYKKWEWKYDFDLEKLDKLFKTWWDYCNLVMDLTTSERFGEINMIDLIEHCANDDERNWAGKKNISLRLNYKLSEYWWINELWDNYLVKKYSLFHNLLKND